jgi:hypothetical protein
MIDKIKKCAVDVSLLVNCFLIGVGFGIMILAILARNVSAQPNMRMLVNPRPVPAVSGGCGTPYTTGLVGWWTMDTTTGSFVDSSGNGYTLTATGSPTTTSGVITNAVSLNGSSQYLTSPANATLNPAAITISCWVKFTGLPTSGNYMCPVYQGAGSSEGIEIVLDSSGNLIVFVNASSGLTYYGPGSHTLAVNTWYFLAVTYSSSTGLIGYVNAASDGTAPAKGTLPNNGLATDIGYNSIYGYYLQGYLDDVRIYNAALTGSQITGIYNDGLPGVTTPGTGCP